jgi:diguanylate cyclase (GGDEF)-like protein
MDIKKYDSKTQTLYQKAVDAKELHIGDYYSACRAFLKNAIDLDDPQLLGLAYYWMSNACYISNKYYDKFMGYLQKALPYLQGCQDYENLARAYNLLGIDGLNHGDPQICLDYFVTALNFPLDEEVDKHILPMIHFNMGQAYAQFGDYKECLKHVTLALKKLPRKKDPFILYMRGSCLVAQGFAFLTLGRTSSAISCMDKLLALENSSENLKKELDEPYTQFFKAQVYHKTQDHESRDAIIDRFVSVMEHGEFSFDVIYDTFRFTDFLIDLGKYDLASRTIAAARSMVETSDVSYAQAAYARLQIHYYSRIHDEENLFVVLQEFYNCSEKHRLEAARSYVGSMNLRNTLEEMRKDNERLAYAAATDALTDLPNRSAMNSFLESIFEECYRKQISLGIELLDIDYFKEFNDTYGHQAGDELLVKVADVLRNVAMDPDVFVARYGGDEFVLTYRGMTDEQVMEKAGRIRTRIKEMAIPNKYSRGEKFITVSQGIRNAVPVEGNRIWDFFYTADNALYSVKRSEKGQIALMHKAYISNDSLEDVKRV